MYLTRTVSSVSSVNSREKGTISISPRKSPIKKQPFASSKPKLRTGRISGFEKTTDHTKVSLIIDGDGIIQVENEDLLMNINEEIMEEIYVLPKTAGNDVPKF